MTNVHVDNIAVINAAPTPGSGSAGRRHAQPKALGEISATPLRILVADDYDIVRRGARAILESQPGWKVCGEAENGRAAVEQAKRLRPDIAVIDMGMPELDGFEVTRQIKAALPQTEILVFTGQETEQVARKVFEAGARGYVLKSDIARQLVTAVQALCEHKMFVSSTMSELICGSFLRAARKTDAGDVLPDCLTSRELESVRLLAEGNSNKEVAALLGVSVRTAEAHRAAIIRKLRLKSFSELVRYAMRTGIINS